MGNFHLFWTLCPFSCLLSHAFLTTHFVLCHSSTLAFCGTSQQDPVAASFWTSVFDQNWIRQGEGVGCIADDRWTHGATRACLTNTPRGVELILDFEVILQFRSRSISLFL